MPVTRTPVLISTPSRRARAASSIVAPLGSSQPSPGRYIAPWRSSAGHEGKDAQRFRGRDRVDVETDRPGHADLALEEPKLIAARRDAQTAHLVPVLRRARLGLQASIEPDAVLPHPHERRRGVEVRHHPRRMPRRSARQRPLVDEHDVRPALPRQMVGDAAPRDAATDDDDARLPPHKREPPPICPGTRAKPENRARPDTRPVMASWTDAGRRGAAGGRVRREGSTGPVPSKGHRKWSARMEPSRAGLAHACRVVRRPLPPHPVARRPPAPSAAANDKTASAGATPVSGARANGREADGACGRRRWCRRSSSPLRRPRRSRRCRPCSGRRSTPARSSDRR